jgi:hypothetical protein
MSVSSDETRQFQQRTQQPFNTFGPVAPYLGRRALGAHLAAHAEVPVRARLAHPPLIEAPKVETDIKVRMWTTISELVSRALIRALSARLVWLLPAPPRRCQHRLRQFNLHRQTHSTRVPSIQPVPPSHFQHGCHRFNLHRPALWVLSHSKLTPPAQLGQL